MNDEELRAAIDQLPAERVTKEGIESRIMSTEYTRIGATATICSITLENGYSVRGESACVSPENFDDAIGKELAFRDAFGKLWALEGYLLAERRWARR